MINSRTGLGYGDFLPSTAPTPTAARWRGVYEQVAAHRRPAATARLVHPARCPCCAWPGRGAATAPASARSSTGSPRPPRSSTCATSTATSTPDVQQELSINGGNRVPVAVFFSEDGYEVARYGERTLSAVPADGRATRPARRARPASPRSTDPLLAQVDAGLARRVRAGRSGCCGCRPGCGSGTATDPAPRIAA